MSDKIVPGKDTTEFKEAQQSNTITIIMAVLSALMLYAPTVLELAPEASIWAIIGAAVLGVVAVVQNMMVKLGYINSRTEIKVAIEKKDALLQATALDLKAREPDLRTAEDFKAPNLNDSPDTQMQV